MKQKQSPPQRSEPCKHHFEADGGPCLACGLTASQLIVAQQPPATAQEWRVIKKDYCFDEIWCGNKRIMRCGQADAVVSHVNAAFIEQRKAYKKITISRDLWEETAKKLDNQLAAERSKVKELEERLKAAIGQADALAKVTLPDGRTK